MHHNYQVFPLRGESNINNRPVAVNKMSVKKQKQKQNKLTEYLLFKSQFH